VFSLKTGYEFNKVKAYFVILFFLRQKKYAKKDAYNAAAFDLQSLSAQGLSAAE